MGGFPSPFHIERACRFEGNVVCNSSHYSYPANKKQKKYVVKPYMVVVVTSITYYEQLSNYFYNTGTKNRSKCVKLHFIMQYSLF